MCLASARDRRVSSAGSKPAVATAAPEPSAQGYAKGVGNG